MLTGVAHLPLRPYGHLSAGRLRYDHQLLVPVCAPGTRMRSSEDATLMPRVARLPAVSVLDLEAVRMRQGPVCQERSVRTGPRLLWPGMRRSARVRVPQVRPVVPYSRRVPSLCASVRQAQAGVQAPLYGDMPRAGKVSRERPLSSHHYAVVRVREPPDTDVVWRNSGKPHFARNRRAEVQLRVSRQAAQRALGRRARHQG